MAEPPACLPGSKPLTPRKESPVGRPPQPSPSPTPHYCYPQPSLPPGTLTPPHIAATPRSLPYRLSLTPIFISGCSWVMTQLACGGGSQAKMVHQALHDPLKCLHNPHFENHYLMWWAALQNRLEDGLEVPQYFFSFLIEMDHFLSTSGFPAC